jgi:hypothetical protein
MRNDTSCFVKRVVAAEPGLFTKGAFTTNREEFRLAAEVFTTGRSPGCFHARKRRGLKWRQLCNT